MKTCIRCGYTKLLDDFLPKRLVCRACLNADRRKYPYRNGREKGRQPPTQAGLSKHNIAPGWGF